jgi:hypothetical protein
MMPARTPYVVALLAMLMLCAFPAARAEGVSSSQRDAAKQFLDAVASGNAQAVANTIHPAELERLRTRVLDLLQEEAKRGDNSIRLRLFGPGQTIADLERLTSVAFYGALGRKLRLTGREYADATWLAGIPDSDKAVHIVLRGKQPKDHGTVQVVTLVTLLPYGQDWKAAIPSEVQAQIDDLIEGRARAETFAAPSAATAAGAAAARAAVNVPGIQQLLDAAEKQLIDGKCDEYYKQSMSPNFRRITSAKAMQTLITSCTNNLGLREMLATTLQLLRKLPPRYEYEGSRAVYDVGGQGLPYDSFALEQVDKRWYIAE